MGVPRVWQKSDAPVNKWLRYGPCAQEAGQGMATTG